MKQMPNSNEEFAERFRKLNRDTKAEQEQLYGGDWSDISINSIISDVVNRSVSYLREGLEGIDEVDNGIGDLTDEMLISVDKKKAAKYGMTVAQVFQLVDKAAEDKVTYYRKENKGNGNFVYLEHKEEGKDAGNKSE